MIDNRKFTIGQMSKLYHIPVKTLRYYDEIGLFKPHEVDEKTGYRYYRVEQFQMLDMIWFMRSMGIPLKEIAKRVAYSTIDDFLSILIEYEELTERRIHELDRARKHLRSKIYELRDAQSIEKVEEPFIAEVDERKMISFQGNFNDVSDVEHVLIKVREDIQHITPIMIGRVGRMASLAQVERDHQLDFHGLFILIDDETDLDKGQITSLEKGMYATLYTRKILDQDAGDVRRLLDFIEQHRYQPMEPILVRRIVDKFISHDEQERLTQIQIKIKSN